MAKIGRVIQGGITINFSSYQENQQTTSPIRNIVDLVHAAEHLGNVLILHCIIFTAQIKYEVFIRLPGILLSE